MTNTTIVGTGSCLPERVLSNFDLEKLVETSDEWITSRTGIHTRRIAGKGDENFRLASRAACKALDMAGLKAKDIDMIIVATISPHMIMPSCACFVQAEIGAYNAYAFDMNAACSGFLYALDMADKYLCSNPDLRILIIGSETLSAYVNWEDRNTCILFGDGAGACVVTGNGKGSGLVGSHLRTDGRLWNLLYMDSPQSSNPEIANEDYQGSYIKMCGRDVFKHAVIAMEEAVTKLLERQSITTADIDLMIPHQANIRILNKLMERIGISEEKVYINVDKYGNTSAASIPIALDEANRQGLIQRGNLLLFSSFGGGFTWGSLLMHW